MAAPTPRPIYANAGTNRTGQVDALEQWFSHRNYEIVALDASDAGAGVTELTATLNGVALGHSAVGIPVGANMEAMTGTGTYSVAAAWLADSAAADDWTVTLWRRRGAAATIIATFSLATT